MSNQLVTTKLPTHLAHLAANTHLSGINAAAGAGISSGGWPRISIKGSRFRLQSPQGEEVVVPQLYLDVIILDANPQNLQKIFYKGAYDPSVEDKAPDCYSDNGVGPSIKSTNPQCGTCAVCPHNAWGSKILPSGKQGKACADVKKLAVFVADNTNGPVLELRVPSASLKNLGEYVGALTKHGIPASAVVTRLTFDTSADYPKIVFQPAMMSDGSMPYINADQADDVMSVIGTEEVDQCTGKNDKPIDPAKLLAAPVAAAPVTPAPVVAPVAVFTPPPVTVPVVAPVAQEAAAVAAPPKRTRRTKAQMDASTATVAAPVPQEAASTPAFLQNQPVPANHLPPAGTAHAPLTAPVTNAALDDLIAKAMAV